MRSRLIVSGTSCLPGKAGSIQGSLSAEDGTPAALWLVGNGVKSQHGLCPGGSNGQLEESSGARLYGRGSNVVLEEALCGRSLGRRCRARGPRIRVSREIRTSTTGSARLFRSQHAGNGNGSEGGPAYHSGRWAKRVRCLG